MYPSGEEPIKSISNVEVKHGRGLDDDDDDVFNVQMDQSDYLLSVFSLLEAHGGTTLAKLHWLASWLAIVHRSLSCCMCQNQNL